MNLPVAFLPPWYSDFWIIGAIVLFVAVRLLKEHYVGPDSAPADKRGRVLITYQAAQRLARRHRREGDPGLVWGGLILPSSAAGGHFAAIGCTGSGKSVTITMLMQSVLPRLTPGSDGRALIYDAKQDAMALLAAIGVPCRLYDLNPFAAGAVAWDIARDVISPAIAFELASILVPIDAHSNAPFFSQAAQHLFYGVLVALMQIAGTSWTFRDVLLACQSRADLEALLKQSPDTFPLIEQYFSVPERIADIVSSLAVKTAPFTFVAAAWDHAAARVSVHDWIAGESILVLGSDERHRAALSAINRVLFRLVSEHVLSQPDSSDRRTWIFLDEASQAGRFDGLGSLLTNGRSKGCSVVLGFQDVEGWRETYGERTANEMVGQCGSIAVLKLNSPATARWAADLFGAVEQNETHRSSSSSKSDHGKSSSNSVSEQLVRRESVLPSEFLALPPPSSSHGISGFYLSAGIGAYQATLPWSWLTQYLPPPAGPSSVPLLPPSHQQLRPWTPAERARLGLPLQPAAGTSHAPGRRTTAGVPAQPGPLSGLKGCGHNP
jgi:hypothetical protein